MWIRRKEEGEQPTKEKGDETNKEKERGDINHEVRTRVNY